LREIPDSQIGLKVPEKTSVHWRAVFAYVAIAFGLAWTVEFVAISQGLRFDSLTLLTTALLASVMLTPAIAAFIVRRFVTREGFATAGLRFGPWRPYLAVWIGVPLLVLAIYAVTVLLGLGQFDPTLSQLTELLKQMADGKPLPPMPPPGVFTAAVLAQTLTFGVVITTVFTFGEEFGWTGYLLVKLLPLGRWRAALIYGTLWGLWHAPVIAAGFNYPGYPVAGVLMMCALTIAFALTQTALRLRSDSVLLTSFFHASINTQGRGIFPLFVIGVSPVLGGLTGIVGIAAFGALGVWLLARTPASLEKRPIGG
jgi:hypothetical protein